MKRTTNHCNVPSALLLIAVWAGPIDASTITFTPIADPSATLETAAYGISGNSIVGSYRDASGINCGFLYNGSTYTTLSDPSAALQYGKGTIAIPAKLSLLACLQAQDEVLPRI